MVVEHKIGGISSREDYIELRNASTDAENVFFSKLQGSLQKNMGGLRLRMRNLVAEFVEEDTTCPMINYVKEHVFGVEGGMPLVPRGHHVLNACFEHPCPSMKGTLLSFVKESPTLTLLRSGKPRTWTFFESAESLSKGRITCLSNMSQPFQKSVGEFLGLFPRPFLFPAPGPPSTSPPAIQLSSL